MAVLEGCRRDYLQVAARVLPLLAGQPNEEEYKGLSESFHMSLRLCIKVAGLVESLELVPIVMVSGTTFTQLSLLVTVECGPSKAHLDTAKDTFMKLWHCLKMKGGPVCRVSVQSLIEKLNEMFVIVQQGNSVLSQLPSTWMLQMISQWCLLLSLLCAVNGEVSLAKELVKSCVVRCKEHMPCTSMGRDLEYLFATSYDGGTQEPGSSTNSMGCAGKVTSASAKPIACAEISSPLLKVWMCMEQGDYIGALTLICEKHNPRFPELYHLMAGWCHFAMSRYNLALAHFSSCLSCEQMMACAMNCMSMCYRRLGQCDLELKMLHYLCEATEPVKPSSTIPDRILICGNNENWVLSHGAIFSNVPSNMAALYSLAQRNLQLNRIAESTAQLRYLMQSMPQHPVMPDDRRLVPAIYVTTIKAFIQEGECKEAIDLCETLSSTFCYEDYQSGIQHGLDIVELRTIVATATYLKGRALMCFMECRAAEALECFESVQAMISNLREESLHTQQILVYIDRIEVITANSLAICLVKLGKNETALASLMSYIANHTVVQQEIMYNYCQLLRAKGLLLEAAKNWLTFRQIWPKNKNECDELQQMQRLQDHSLSCGTPDDVALLCNKYDADWLKYCAVHQLWKELH